MEEELGGGVVELVGVHGADDAEVIGDGGEVGEHFGDFGLVFSVFVEVVEWAEEFGGAFDEGEGFAGEEFFGAVFEVVFFEFGFVVEEFVLRWRPGHVEVDDSFGFWGQLGCAWGGGARRFVAGGSVSDLSEGEGAEAGVALLEKVASGEVGGLGG